MCSESQSNQERRRHSNGTFASRRDRTDEGSRSAALHIDRQKRFLSSIKVTSDKVYERLLDVVFLPAGSKKLFVPATSKSGPLRTIVKRLFKRKYVVSVNRQSFLTRVRYFNGASNRKAEHVPKMRIRAADDPTERHVEKRVYKMRRLPELSRQCTERADVRRWIRFAISQDALVVTNEEEAYEVIRKVVQTHHVIDGQSAYDGYPCPEETEGAQSPPSSSHPDQDRSVNQEDAEQAVDASQIEEHNACPDGSRSPNTQRASPPVEDVVPVQQTEDNILYLRMTDMVIITAQNDDLFLFLCKVDDDRSDSMVGLIAALLLEKMRDFSIQTSALVMDVLQYAHGRHCGTKHVRQHEERRQRIRLIVQVLKLTRAVLGKTPYERMEWRAATTVAERLNAIEQNARMNGLWSQR